MRMLPGRRQFLFASGVGMALPMLERFQSQQDAPPPQRTVLICSSLGFHAPNVIPEQVGQDYTAPEYLRLLEPHRDSFSVFSGLSHPDQNGANGHSSEMTWLTSAPHPGLGGFRNTISIDQLAAEKLGFVTRFPSLVLGTATGSQSYTRGGVMIPAESRPSKVFASLFLDGTADEIERQITRLNDGKSILDTVREQARSLQRSSSPQDAEKLEEYYQSIREMEVRLNEAQAWARRPKPHVDAEQPVDIQNQSDLIGRTRLIFDLIPLALQTDSTRIISVLIQGRSDVPVVDGVDMDHHNLSHHGQDPQKLRQLGLIERAQFEAFGDLLSQLKSKQEAGGSVLDNTSVLFGSNLGNANSHNSRNLPIVLAGGPFRHGRHLAFDKEHNTPLSNLFVSLLQQVGVEVDQFGSSTSRLDLDA